MSDTDTGKWVNIALEVLRLTAELSELLSKQPLTPEQRQRMRDHVKRANKVWEQADET